MMKKSLLLLILYIFGGIIYGQVLRHLPNKTLSELDIVFSKLDMNSNENVLVNEVEDILDSLTNDSESKSITKIVKLDGLGDTIYSIGDATHGGIVFWISKDGKHGLVAAPNDLSGGVTWNSALTTNLRDGLYCGKFNSDQIILNKGVGYYAAKMCRDYKGGGFDDWYLPSLYELNLLYQNRRIIGNFYRDYYWSSSEEESDIAWLIYFYNGFKCSYHAYGTKIYRVRPIRAF